MAIEAEFYLGLLLGFIVAAVVFFVWTLQKGRQNKEIFAQFTEEKKALSDMLLTKTAQTAALGERMAHHEGLVLELSQVRSSFETLRDEKAHYLAKISNLELENLQTNQYLEQRIKDLSLVHDQMRKSFSSISEDALLKNADLIKSSFHQSMEHFFKMNEQDRNATQNLLNNVMNPLKESLMSVDNKVGELESKRQGAYDGLKEQIEGLLKSQVVLQKETQNLSRALHAPTVRGRWGEMQLKRVVELSGLSSHCDFIEQKSINIGGDVLRPDMIVTLPKNKKIVVDAKAPLEFLPDGNEKISLEDQEEGRRQQLAASLRRHILSLKKKSYQSSVGQTPEFVVMFLPGEAFLHWALLADPMLLDFAAQHDVLITTPITLVALLKSVAFGFSQESLANNIEEVRHLAQQLIDRVKGVNTHFEKLGRSLKLSVETYNQTLASLDKRVLVTARKLSEIKSIATSGEAKLESSLASLEVLPNIVESAVEGGEKAA